MNRQSRILLFFSFFVYSLFSSAQVAGDETNCSNGIDDGGDGFVDCYDLDCKDDNSCTEFFFGNNVTCSDDPDVTNFSIRRQWGSADKTANSHAMPAVGDLDGDGVPEVVVNNRQENTMTVLSGTNGATLWQVNLGWQPENVMALIRFDTDDDMANIFVYEDRGDDMAMYEYQNTTPIWTAKAVEIGGMGYPGFADFNQDGTPELYERTSIRDAQSGALLIDGTDYLSGGETLMNSVVAATVAADFLTPADGCIGDCNGLELASGRYIYSVNLAAGTMTAERDMWDLLPGNNNKFYPKVRNNQAWTGVSVADYNQDGRLDVLVSGAHGNDNTDQTAVFFWDFVNGTIDYFEDTGNNHNKGTGRLNIADLDNDGQLNVNYVSNNKLYSLDENLNLLWKKTIDELSSGFTGCTLFDFDDDGTIETVYRSESRLIIIDGTDGSDRFSIPCVSRTQEEYPIVADVDGDGASEICVTCYTSNSTPFDPYNPNTTFGHVRVYEADGGETWQPSRPVWNQASYFNVNVNDDLTIPRQQQDHSVVFSSGVCSTGDNRALNQFMVQSPILNEDGCSNYVTPDLDLGSTITATNAQCPETDLDVTFDISNTGDVAVSGTVPVSFYAGDPFSAGSTYLNTDFVQLSNLDINETATYTLTANGIGGDYDIYLVINFAGGSAPITFNPASIPECGDGTNNVGSVGVTSDPFTLTVNKIFDNRKCSPGGDLLPDNGQAQAYFDGNVVQLQDIYRENFDGLENATDDSSDPISPWSASPGSFDVVDKGGNLLFEVSNSDQDIVWTTGIIDLQGYTNLNNVSITLDMFAEGPMESADYMYAEYFFYDASDVQTETGTMASENANFTYVGASASGLPANPSSVKVEVRVTMNNSASNEDYLLDNVRITGYSSISGQFTEANGFSFRWYDDAGLTNLVHTGSTFPTMGDGDYWVRGYYTDGDCYSDVQTINIGLDASINFTAAAEELSPLTDCSTPDGSVRAFAHVIGDPSSEFTTGYTYEWRLASEDVTTLSTAQTMSNLQAGIYKVYITESLTGCVSTTTAEVTTGLVDPDDINVVATPVHITACGGTGEISAYVADDPNPGDQNTTDYTFEWSNGTVVKATPDFTGITYSGITSGMYTVQAIQDGTQCPSTAVTIELLNNSSEPQPTATTTDNTSCGTNGNGTITVDPDGAGSADPADYTYEFFVGNNTQSANELPAALAGAAVGSDPWIMTGLIGDTYTIRVTETATGCDATITTVVTDNITDPEFNFLAPIDAGDVLETIRKGFIFIPQALAGKTAMTVSFWVKLSPDNYANDHTLWSAGDNAISVMGIWADDNNGISFSITTVNGGLSVVSSNFESSGWTNIAATWSETTSLQSLYIDGVLAGQKSFAGNGGLDDGGPDMYFGRDSNLGANKFEGQLDEFRVFDYAVDASTLLAAVCDPTAAANDALLYYDFNSLVSTAKGDHIPNLGTLTLSDPQNPGADAIIDKPGNSPGDVTNPPADYVCPLVGAVNNTSCDPLNPTGMIDMTDLVDPIGANYEYTLYDGYATTTQLSQNTSGIFNNLADGFYTMVVSDTDSDCETDPLFFSIASQPDNPNITTTTVDDTSCDGASTFTGEIAVNVSSTTSSGPYTIELFDGANFNMPTLSTVSSVINHTFTGLEDGAYRIRVTDESIQCDNFVDVIVNDSPASPTFTAASASSVPNTSCGTPNGLIKVGIQGEDVNDYQFDWYDGGVVDPGNEAQTGVGLDEYLNLSAGTYTVVATNTTSNCTTSVLVVDVVDQPTFPDISLVSSQDQTDCAGGDGRIEVQIDDPSEQYGCDGGTFCNDNDIATIGFTYAWYVGSGTGGASIGGNSVILDNVPAGVYTFEVTDPLGCPNTFEHTIGVTQIFPVVTLNNTTDNTGCDAASFDGTATFDLEFDGATITDYTGYTFTIYQGSGTGGPVQATGSINTFGGLENGGYTLVVDAPNSCSSTELEFNIGFSPITPDFIVDTVTPNATQNNTVCDITLATGGAFNRQITVVPNDGTNVGDYTYEWFDGAGTGSPTAFTATNNVLSGLPGGTYTVRITDTGNTSNNCETIIQHTITDDFTDIPVIDDLAGASSKNDITVCEDHPTWPNGDLTASVTGGSSVYEYRWYYGSSADASKLIVENDNIASRKGTGTSNALVVGAASANIQNLDAGFYTLQVLDTDRGCYSLIETFELVDDLTTFVATAQTNSDDYSCDTNNPSGIVEANVTGGNAGYTFEWYKGTTTNASAQLPAAVASSSAIGVNGMGGLPQGTYTVKIIDDATACFELLTTIVEKEIPTFTLNMSQTDQTGCFAPNGTASVNVTNSFSLDGFTPSYSYQWYDGQGTGTILTGETASTLTGVPAGYYTVMVTESNSGCAIATNEIEVVDAISANAPNFSIVTDVLPTSCNDGTGQISGTISPNPGGNTYNLIWFAGSQNYADDNTLGTPLQTDNNTTSSTLSGLNAGLYTLVAEDIDTRCRYQEVYELEFVGIQATTTLAIKHVENCPDDGTATVQLADQIEIEYSITSGGPFLYQEEVTGSVSLVTGVINSDAAGKIGVTVEPGSNFDPTDVLTGGTSGTQATIVGGAAGITFEGFVDDGYFDDISEYDIYLYVGNGVPANPDDTYLYEGITFPQIIPANDANVSGTALTFTNLPAGEYTAVARQKVDPDFAPGNADRCFSKSATDEIEQRAYEPIISSFTTDDNTLCNYVATFPSTTNPAVDYQDGDGEITINAVRYADDIADDPIQPGLFSFTWYAGTDNTGTILQTTSNAALSVLSNLEPGDYFVEVEREGLAGPAGNGCTVDQVFTVGHSPQLHEITDANVLDVVNCDTDDSSITIEPGDITEAPGNYTYTWYKDTYPGGLIPAENTASIAGYGVGQYFVEATHIASGCPTNLADFEVVLDTTDPVVDLTVTSVDTSCDPTDDNGNGSIDFSITNDDGGNYDFQWFTGTSNTPGNEVTGASVSGDNGSFTTPTYNGTLSGINGNTYTLEVIDTSPNSRGCPVIATITVNEESTEPTLFEVDNLSLSDNLNCTNFNGFIEVISVKEDGADVPVVGGNYTFQWFEDPQGLNNDITASAIPGISAVGIGNRIQGIAGNTYGIIVTNTLTGCSNGVVIEVVIEDVTEDPIVQATASNDDSYCDNTGNTGDGTLDISVAHPATLDPVNTAEYTISWYRGTGTGTFMFDNQGATGLAGDIGDAAANADFTELTGLASGNYTVVVSKNVLPVNDPNFGCDAMTTFAIPKVEDIPVIDQSAVRAKATNNTNCVTGYDGSFIGNGSILFDDSDVSTGDLSDFEITVEKDAVGSGDVRFNSVNPVATSITVPDLETGAYFISARNTATNCTAAAARVNIEDDSSNPNVLLVDINDNLNCTSGTDAVGSITITADGSDETAPNLDFEWFNGPGIGASLGITTAAISNLNAGQYTVRVRDNVTGCETIREYEIEDQEDLPIMSNYDLRDQSFCNPNGAFVLLGIIQTGSALTTTEMFNEGYLLEVYTSGGVLVNSTTGTLDPIDDADFDGIPDAADIDEFPSDTDSDGDGIADSFDIDFNPTATDSDGDGIIDSADTFPYYEIQDLAIGSYYAVITNNGSNCTSERVDFDVADEIVYPLIEVTVDINDDPCSLGNGQISATADGNNDTNTDYQFTWFEYDNTSMTRGALVGNTSTVSNLEGGFYEIEVFNSTTGCTISQVAELTSNAIVEPAITTFEVQDAFDCNPADGYIRITGMNQDTPQEYDFELFYPDNTTSLATITAGSEDPVEFESLAAGTYWITSTHATRSGCVSATQFEVTVGDISTPPEIVITFVPNTRCDPATPNGELNATADGSTSTDPVTGYNFDWLGVNGTATPTLAQGQGTPDLFDIPEGDYVLTVTNNQTGCVTVADTYTLTSEAPEPLQISTSTSANTNCVNPNGKMAATVIQPQYPIAEYDFLWYDGIVANPDLNNPDYTGSLVEDLANGDYTLVVRDSPAFGNDICQSAVLTITVEDERDDTYTPEVEVLRDKIYCYDEFVQGLGLAQVTNEDLGQFSIEWTSLTNPGDPRFPQVGFFADSLQVGNYQVSMLNLITGCEYTTDFSIIDATETIPNPEVTLLSNDTNCTFPNGEAVATVDGQKTGYRFDWFDGSDTGLTTVLFSGSQPSSLVEGNYLVRATNLETGCESGASPLAVQQVITDPLFEIIATNSLCLRTEDGAINQFNGEAFIRFSSLNFVDSAAWFYENGDRIVSNASGNPIQDGAVNDLGPGNYSVTFRADNGCTYSANFTINTAVQVFNFVTANGDSKNDFFLIDCLDFFPNNTVEIFTRAGQSVYFAEGYDNSKTRFEGYSDRGKALPDGTYYYIIDRGDGSELLQGYIELLR